MMVERLPKDWCYNYVLMPLMLPFIIMWLVLAYALVLITVLTVIPVSYFSEKLKWSCPFVPCLWKKFGIFAPVIKIAFEISYTVNILTRLLTLPLRWKKPDFYIIGFPKAGTTSLANYLRSHSSIDSIAGLPIIDLMLKESHFFNGVLGCHHASSEALYRSFFPTVLRKWWVEAVLRKGPWLCFDACPIPVCLPYAASRIAAITPNAKIIIMLRDPVASMFSAEIMMRNLGINLSWSLMDEMRDDDERFIETEYDTKMWNKLENLSINDSLPLNLPNYFYTRFYSYLQSRNYIDRIEPFLRHFPKDNLMFIEFKEFVTKSKKVVDDVLNFVGADTSTYKFIKQSARMQTDYKGRQMHPMTKKRLEEYFRHSNIRLFNLLSTEFSWGEEH